MAVRAETTELPAEMNLSAVLTPMEQH